MENELIRLSGIASGFSGEDYLRAQYAARMEAMGADNPWVMVTVGIPRKHLGAKDVSLEFEFGMAFRSLDVLHQSMILLEHYGDPAIIRDLHIFRGEDDWNDLLNASRLPDNRLKEKLEFAWRRLVQKWREKEMEIFKMSL